MYSVAQYLEAKIDISASGDNSIIAAVAGKRHRIARIVLLGALLTTVKFKDGAASDLTGDMTLAAGQPLILDATSSEWPLATLSVNSAFIINLGGGVQCSGRVYYVTD